MPARRAPPPELTNFRSYTRRDLDIAANIVCSLGTNGDGKTN